MTPSYRPSSGRRRPCGVDRCLCVLRRAIVPDTRRSHAGHHDVLPYHGHPYYIGADPWIGLCRVSRHPSIRPGRVHERQPAVGGSPADPFPCLGDHHAICVDRLARLDGPDAFPEIETPRMTRRRTRTRTSRGADPAPRARGPCSGSCCDPAVRGRDRRGARHHHPSRPNTSEPSRLGMCAEVHSSC